MDYLIPTLLGIAGALAPVAFGYLRQQPAMSRRLVRSSRFAAVGSQLTLDDAVIRGGRVYL